MKFSTHSAPERRIDRLMLADSAHSFEAPRDHTSGIMVAVAREIADRHLGVRNRRLNQPLDLLSGHGHQRLVLSMICRRASISLLRSASRTLSSSQSTPAE